MSTNPLQNYFRQPKIYLKLPSLGKFSNSSVISGDVENLPIYGMTGMDQILIKTPDALLNGDSTVKVIQSCCPNILNAWELSNLDIDSLLVAIRIATYGNVMSITKTCKSCSTESTYDLDISSFLQHYNLCKFESDVVVNDLIIKLKPLTYHQATKLGLENYALQKQLKQAYDMDESNERQDLLSKIYADFGILKNKILLSSIDYIETPSEVVSEYGFIKEWLDNCDQDNVEKIRSTMDLNVENWKVPSTKVQCTTCGNINEIDIDLDASSFFAKA